MISTRRARIILASLIALCALFVYSYATRLVELATVEAEVVAMQARVDEAHLRQQRLDDEQAALNDPDFLEEAARVLFDYSSPGDTVLVIIKETPVAPGVAMISAGGRDARALSERARPVWRQWIDFFATESAFLP